MLNWNLLDRSSLIPVSKKNDSRNWWNHWGTKNWACGHLYILNTWKHWCIACTARGKFHTRHLKATTNIYNNHCNHSFGFKLKDVLGLLAHFSAAIGIKSHWTGLLTGMLAGQIERDLTWATRRTKKNSHGDQCRLYRCESTVTEWKRVLKLIQFLKYIIVTNHLWNVLFWKRRSLKITETTVPCLCAVWSFCHLRYTPCNNPLPRICCKSMDTPARCSILSKRSTQLGEQNPLQSLAMVQL